MSHSSAERKLAGSSAAVRSIIEEVDRAAGSDVRVLISGDTVVRKDLIARRIHEQSARNPGPFVAMTCTKEERDILGSLEQANRGTLFLDEVGELDPHLQEALLTFLETSELDVRIIAASSRDLHHEVIAGRFDAALFYRLNVIHILVPERRERDRTVSRQLGELQHDLGASS